MLLTRSKRSLFAQFAFADWLSVFALSRCLGLSIWVLGVEQLGSWVWAFGLLGCCFGFWVFGVCSVLYALGLSGGATWVLASGLF